MTDFGASSYRRFLQGDEKGLEELIRGYGDALVRFAYCFLEDSDAAEDAVEDSFVALVVKRKRLETDENFRAYLYKIVRNKCMDSLRKRKKIAPLGDLENVLHGADPVQDAMRSLLDRQVYAAVQQLPAQYREVIHLFYFEEFSAAEIASILKKNRKQVYNLLSRAKALLKERLIKEGIHHAYFN